VFSRIPALSKYVLESGHILLPGQENSIDDEILTNIIQSALRSATDDKGFSMDIEENPVACISAHVVLTLLEMAKEAEILLEHMWSLFAQFELKAEHVSWIWDNFAPSIERRPDAEAWPAGPYRAPFGIYYINLAAWQILNLKSEGKLDETVEKYVYGSEIFSQPRLREMVEKREKKYGLDKGYDMSKLSPELRAMSKTNAFARLQNSPGWSPDKKPDALTYAKYYRDTNDPGDLAKPGFDLGRSGSGMSQWKTEEKPAQNVGESKEDPDDNAQPDEKNAGDSNPSKFFWPKTPVRSSSATPASGQAAHLASPSGTATGLKPHLGSSNVSQGSLPRQNALDNPVQFVPASEKPPSNIFSHNALGNNTTAAMFGAPSPSQQAGIFNKPPNQPTAQNSMFNNPPSQSTPFPAQTPPAQNKFNFSPAPNGLLGIPSTQPIPTPTIQLATPPQNNKFNWSPASNGPFGGTSTQPAARPAFPRPNQPVGTRTNTNMFGHSAPSSNPHFFNAAAHGAPQPSSQPTDNQFGGSSSMFNNAGAADTSMQGNGFNPAFGGGASTPGSFNPPASTTGFGNNGNGQAQGGNGFVFSAGAGENNPFAMQPNMPLTPSNRRKAVPKSRLPGRRGGW
jgi:hypothetical protein